MKSLAAKQIFRSDESVVTVFDVEHSCRVEHVHVVEHSLARKELEEGAGRYVMEVVVVSAVPAIPACATEYPLFVADYMIDSDGVGVVLGSLRQGRIRIVVQKLSRSGRPWRRKVLKQRLGHRVDQLGRDDIPLEWILYEVARSRGVSAAREGIINLILRPQGQ